MERNIKWRVYWVNSDYRVIPYTPHSRDFDSKIEAKLFAEAVGKSRTKIKKVKVKEECQ